MKSFFTIPLLVFLLSGLLAHGQPSLDELKTLYTTKSGEISATRDTAFKLAQIDYIANLNILKAEFQAAGDLDGLLATTTAIKAADVPDVKGTIAMSDVVKLKAVQAVFNRAIQTATAKALADKLALNDQFRGSLVQMQTDLTKSGKIKEALEVKELLSRIPAAAAPTTRQAEASAPPHPEADRPAVPAGSYSSAKRPPNSSRAIIYSDTVPPKFADAEKMECYPGMGKSLAIFPLKLIVMEVNHKMTGKGAKENTFQFARFYLAAKNPAVPSVDCTLTIAYYGTAVDFNKPLRTERISLGNVGARIAVDTQARDVRNRKGPFEHLYFKITDDSGRIVYEACTLVAFSRMKADGRFTNARGLGRGLN